MPPVHNARGVAWIAFAWIAVAWIAVAALLWVSAARAQDKLATEGGPHPGTDVTAIIRAGISLMQAHDFAAAEARFSQAIRIDPHASEARVWRGICENQLQHYQAAATDFRAALHLDPNTLPAHYNLALSLLRLKNVDQAQHEFEVVTAADPTSVEAQYNLALLLEGRHLYAEARDHLAVAIEARPSDLGVTEHLLLDDLRLNRSADAEELVQHLAAETAPPKQQLHAGTELLQLGYFPQASTLLEAAHARLPASRETDLLLARAYIGSQEGSKAIPLLGDANGAGDAAYLLGLAYLSSGELQKAQDSFHAAVAAHPGDAGSLFQLARLAEHAGGLHRTEGLTGAVSNLRKAVTLEPRNSAYSLALGRMLLELDKPAEALRFLNRTSPEGEKPARKADISDVTESAERTLLLGIAQAATGGVALAQPALERAIKLAPKLSLAHNVLGFCRFSQGHYAEAAAAYRQASDLQPENDIFAYDAALAFERAGAYLDALVYARRAASLDNSTAEDHYLLGKLYLQTKDRDTAIRELKTAATMRPGLEPPYYLLSRTYMQMGNRDEAKEWSDKLTLLKEKHNPLSDEGMGSSTSSPAVASSLLLQGAPVKVDDAKEGR